MFASAQNSRGVVSLSVVAMALAAWVVGMGAMVKSWRDGAQVAHATGCQVVCSAQAVSVR